MAIASLFRIYSLETMYICICRVEKVIVIVVQCTVFSWQMFSISKVIPPTKVYIHMCIVHSWGGLVKLFFRGNKFLNL